MTARLITNRSTNAQLNPYPIHVHCARCGREYAVYDMPPSWWMCWECQKK
jgi:ribosomal protein S27E